jgi:pyruvate,water dikinase
MHRQKVGKNPYILWFEEIGIEDIAQVGGKNASLGEMYRRLSSKGVRVPNGFAVTAEGYKSILKESDALKDLKAALKGVDLSNSKALEEAGKEAREIILNCSFPSEIEESIEEAYNTLSQQYRMKRADVAVRSSATAEDLPEASFAGQQESFLNISGPKNLLQACKRCFASLFTGRAIAYRADRGFGHFEVYISVGVQKMVRADEGSAGVIFTLDPESGFPHVVYITGSFGLGESVVQGAVNPDEFYVFKPTLKKGFKPIIDRRLGSKETKISRPPKATAPFFAWMMTRFCSSPSGRWRLRNITAGKMTNGRRWISNGPKTAKQGNYLSSRPEPKQFNRGGMPLSSRSTALRKKEKSSLSGKASETRSLMEKLA